MAKNHTIFQNLDRAFSGNWGSSSQPHINSYDMSNVDKGILYRTKSKEDYENKKLELQQSKYLKDRWVKANVDLSVSAFAGLNNVKLMYRDCDLMDGFPEISAALDIVSEESCLVGDTKIYLTNNLTLTIKQLYDDKYTNFKCYTMDNDGIIKVAQIEKVIYKGIKELYEIILDDDTSIKCTDNHQWMKPDMSWVETKDLKNGDYLTGILTKSHKVVSVKKLGIKDKVYDLFNSDVNHSFAVKCNEGFIISHNCIPNSKGNIINVYSSSERIKSIIEDLFVNRLNIQITAPMIIRSMCKYGNQFMLLDIDNKLGVKDWKQLPVFNVERIENGIANPYSSLAMSNASNGDMSTKFVWTDETNSQVPFRNWQIAHFRLLTNSLYLPYGCLIGDTRIETEYGYKEIKDIKIGDKVWTFNVDTQKRELSTVTMWMNKGEKDTIILYTKHHQIEGTPDHKILVYEDDKLTYKELGQVKKDDLVVVNNLCKEEFEDVRIDKSDLKPFEHGKKSLAWWHKYINNVPDIVNEDFARLFGFLLGDGWISHGFHVMFALGEYASLNDKYIKLLEELSGKKASFVSQDKRKHRKLPFNAAFVGSKMLTTVLRRMGFNGDCYTKRIPTWVYKCNKNIKEEFINGLIDSDGTMKIVSKHSIEYTIELANEMLIKDIKTLAESLGYRTGKVSERDRIGYKSNKNNIVTTHKSYYFSFYKDENKELKCCNKFVWKDKGVILEKVRSSKCTGKKTTYDITVDNNNSNFFANGIVTHNCSYLNGARRHFRMLSLMEDMMLIYRLERSIERRVYKIYVGAIDDADVQAYVENIANQFKRTPIIDPMTGQLDLRKNILPVHKDTPIPLLDGRTITIQDLAKEYEGGKTNYVYSIQDKTLRIVPGKIIWCGKNYTADELVKITLDDDSYMIMAKEHEVVMRDGTKKRADELSVGESVMPFYRKIDKTEYISATLKNHKITKIEIIGGDDVYCMTVVGENGEEDRHNFALRTWNQDGSWNENGCFVSNCVDQDLFIPTRSENAPNPVDTLPSAQNLTAIDDIKFVQNKVCTALRIPKTFLNFEETTGDGKNLALEDIRFTRTVNRIQQAFLMELTKVASIHLYLLGFTDDLTNFSLTMNNPSTQAEQLEIDNLQKKISACRDAISDPGNGIPVFSQSRALKEIMKWSDKEIKDNLEEIRLEKALAAELEKTSQIIKRTGVFDIVDRMYGEPDAQYQDDAQQQGDGGMGDTGGGGMPPMGGGGDFGSGLDDLGAPGGDENGDLAGAEGAEPTSDMGGGSDTMGGSDIGAAPSEGMPTESLRKKNPLITEETKKKKYNKALKESEKRTDILFSQYLKHLDEEQKKKRNEVSVEKADVYDKSLLINEEFNKMIEGLDKKIKSKD